MLVCDAPVAIDLAQAHSQSEQKAVLVYRIAGRVRSAPHDGDREGDVRACGNGGLTRGSNFGPECQRLGEKLDTPAESMSPTRSMTTSPPRRPAP
jgi:hypothetical protein